MKASSLIIVFLMIFFYISACSANDNTEQESTSTKHNSQQEIAIPEKATTLETKDNQVPDLLSFETVLAGKNPTSNFSIDAEHNFFQLKIINKSKLFITFSLVNNETGKEIFTDQVKPNKILTWNSNIDYPTGLDSGKYTIQYRSNGNNMNGIAYGQLSQTPEGLR